MAVDLKLERLKRATDNATVTPRELMDLIIDAMDGEGLGGELTRAIVIVETKKPDGTYGVESFRAGCTWYEEIALTELHKVRQIELWRG